MMKLIFSALLFVYFFTRAAAAQENFERYIIPVSGGELEVDRTSILPEIKQVGNGWISAGYQLPGYGLVPVY